MRQIGILPAGCQIYGQSLLFANHEIIYYASTLAIYVYCAKSFTLLKVVTISDKTLCSISVLESDPDTVAAVSHDGCISLWRLSDSFLRSKVNTQLHCRINLVYREIYNTNNVLFISSEPHIRILLWDTSKISAPLTELFAVKKSNMKAVVGAWNPHLAHKFAVGCSNGWILFLDTHLKTEQTLQAKDRASSIVDLKWDKLSSVYLLAAYTHFVTLWDTETMSEIQIFERQHHPISAISWLEWTAGNFMTTNSKTGHARIWNVSQKVPLDTIKLTSTGIKDLFVAASSKSAVSGNIDGSISVFNLFKRQTEYCSAAGHTDTVFDCAFDPTSAEVFATASYDGTVKIWNVSNLSLVKTLYGGDVIIYNCSWSRNGKFIAGSCGNGEIVLWDVDSGRELVHQRMHTKASYAVAWSKSSDGIFCSTSADGTCFVVKVNSDYLFGNRSPISAGGSPLKSSGGRTKSTPAGSSVQPVEVLLEYLHPAPVFGCAWSYHHPAVFATGCQDGHVRVFNYQSVMEPLVFDLQGHTKRSFNAVWSLLEKGLIASGSDDSTILLWRVDLSSIPVSDIADVGPKEKLEADSTKCTTVLPTIQLVGHKSNVRAITFSSESKQLLISGAWDASIRLWDIATGQCLKIVYGHGADVYGITAHPDRPFTYITCSRDTTVRIWELEGIFAILRASAILDIGLQRAIQADQSSQSPESSSDLGSDTSLVSIMGYRRPAVESSSATSTEQENAQAPKQRTKPILRPVLQGRGSLRLHRLLMQNAGSDRFSNKINAAECYYRLYSFFCGANGSMDLWEAILLYLKKQQAQLSGITDSGVAKQGLLRLPNQRIVFHEDEVIARAFEESVRRSTKKKSLDNDELLLQTALMQIKCGNFQGYCDMMTSLGEWTAALAVAPRVSMEYWHSLASQYADYLQSQSSEQCVPTFLCCGRVIDATEFYLRRRETENAFFVAVNFQRNRRLARRDSGLRNPSSFDFSISDPAATDAVPIGGGQSGRASPRHVAQDGESKSKEGFYLDMGDEKDDNDGKEDDSVNDQNLLTNKMEADRASRSMVSSVYEFSARLSVQNSRVILAAAYKISAGNITEAIQLLRRSGEIDLAYAVAFCTDKMSDDLLVAFADMLAKNGVMRLGLELLDRSSNPEINKGLLYSKYYGSSADQAHTLLRDFELKSFQHWLKRGAKEEAIGSDVDAVMCYVMGLDYAKAISVGLRALRTALREPLEMKPDAKRIVYFLKCMRCDEIPESIRVSYYCHMLWLVAHEAIEGRMWETACAMLRLLRTWSARCVFFISPTDVSVQELRIKVICGFNDCLAPVQELLKKESLSAQIAEPLRNIDGFIAAEIRKQTETRGPRYAGRTPEGGINLSSAESTVTQLRPWTIHKQDIFRECQSLGTLAGLPSLAKLIALLEPGIPNQFIREGSSLPCGSDWNRHVSCISRKPIVGLPVVIDKANSVCASANEWLEWSFLLPFSPTLGDDSLWESENV